MLEIILGRSGSGKTSYINSVLGGLARKGKNKLLIIVPEQFSFATERLILTSVGTKDAQKIEVLSFTRLADFVNRKVGGLSGSFADDASKIIIMLRALEGIQDQLKFYSKHIHSISLAKDLIKLCTEFKNEHISYQMLEEASLKSDIKVLSVKLHELSLIYQSYTSLFQNNFEDIDNLPDMLADTIAESDFFRGYTIAIDAFKGYTAQEFELIRLMMLQADNLMITLCTPDIYARDASMIWESVNKTGKELIGTAKKEGIKVKQTKTESGKRFNSDELKFLEQNIFSPSATVYNDENRNVKICEASTLRDECSYIAATIKKLVRSNEIRLKDIAVIVRNEDEYIKELNSCFAKYNIPFFEDARQPIMNQPLITLCKSVLTILNLGFTTENILHYFKTGLSPINDVETARLENYALMWQFTSKNWQNDFTLNPISINEGNSEESDNELAELNTLRKKALTPLFSLKKKISSQKTLTAEYLSRAFYQFLISSGVDKKLKELAIEYNNDGYDSLAKEQNRIWEILMTALDKLASIYGEYPTSVSTYYNLFCAVIAATDIGNIPHGLDEVTIGSADRIRLSSPKVVFVSGCEEGVFPRSIEGSDLLSLNDRKHLETLGISMSTPVDLKASEERFIAYTAATAATDRIYVTYHVNEGAGSSLQPSIIVSNIRELFENLKDKENGIIHTENLDCEYFSETDSSLFASYAREYANKESSSEHKTKLNTLRYILNKNEELSSRLKAFDSLSDRKQFEISDEHIASNLFGKTMYLSASRVDVYHHCPFKYFCQYGIGARAREKAELKPAVSGTVIHYVL